MKRKGETETTGGAPAGRPPQKPAEGEESLIGEDLQRYMSPEEAVRYVGASTEERHALHDKIRARAAASLL